jgi:pentapeptide repeat protein
VAPGFAASTDFAIDKPAGRACPNLRPDFACGIHVTLREKGFPGCTVYDCFGAGQKVAQHTYGGRDWRRHPDEAGPMFAVFGVMRGLHELIWHLTEALRLGPADPLPAALEQALDQAVRLSDSTPEELLAFDLPGFQRSVNGLLVRVSQGVRGDGPSRRGGDRYGVDRAHADLVGADLRGADLRRASLRGALLIGADLRRARLDRADLTGADLRGARLDAADLAGAIFVTQAQLDAAKGDTATTIPPGLTRPAHWPRNRTDAIPAAP